MLVTRWQALSCYLRHMPAHLHIICLDVPYPVNYGGVFDLFYKLPALQQQGFAIHLHCFDYGRGEQQALNQYCASVHYYRRQKKLMWGLPYIVSSRSNQELILRLLQDDYPILMEGVHCTYPLTDKRFEGRKMFVRLHNTEFTYYYHLYKHAARPFAKLYYWIESGLLKRYERRIADKADHFWAVSHTDVQLYRQHFGCRRITYLPLFLPPWQVASRPGFGTYCLYQGNLEVEENETAALWLLHKIFAQLAVPFVIAGKNPSRRLLTAAARHPHTRVVPNAPEATMEQLIAGAHIHILPSFNATGIKIKLLNALYNGRHCLINTAAAKGTPLTPLCHLADTAEAMKQKVKELMALPFSPQAIAQRKEQLQQQFDNQSSAAQIAAML